ncbi:hypothetical protein [Neobacillus sp. NPDC093127]|uniref:hypothetical protein n=1 Tax=Neobacillus sp. NPDC093127 TaxID=3364296 RepID=UPI0037FB9D9A
MKGSEALLRAIAAAGGTISGTQLDEWMAQLLKAGFIKKGETPFTYELTDVSKNFLKKKGVDV